jgi:hypothetical protein
MKNKIYYIEWLDSQSDDGWVLFDRRDKISNMVIKTIGFFIDENKEYIRLALSIGQNKNKCNKQYSGTIAIAKRCIIKKEKL